MFYFDGPHQLQYSVHHSAVTCYVNPEESLGFFLEPQLYIHLHSPLLQIRVSFLHSDLSLSVFADLGDVRWGSLLSEGNMQPTWSLIHPQQR